MAQELKDFIDNSFKLIKECHKSQESLQKHMLNDAKRYRELINFASQSNKKVEVEINYAQHLLNSLLSSCAAIKSSTTDMKKDLIERKQLREKYQTRIKTVVLKYENKWSECSQRFEGMVVFQKWREILNTTEELKFKIEELHKHTDQVNYAIRMKAQEIVNVDNTRIINLAKYFVYDGEKLIRIIQNKRIEIQNKKLIYEKKCKEKQNKLLVHKLKTIKNVLEDESALPYLNLSMEMPKLDILYNEYKNDMDFVHQPKLRIVNEPKHTITNINELKPKSAIINEPIRKHTEIEVQSNTFMDAYIQYKKNELVDKDNTNNTKPIKIIYNMKINTDEARNIISNINTETVKVVELIEGAGKQCQIGPDVEENEEEPMLPPTQFDDNSQQVVKEDDMLFPPTQFKDCSQDWDSSDNIKKKVSFQLPEIVDLDQPANKSDQITDMDVDDRHTDNIELNTTAQTPLPASVENYNELLKDLYLKKCNLDLSPKFVYAKRDSYNIHAEKPITSKFFGKNNDEEKIIKSELIDIDQQKTRIAEDVHLNEFPEVNYAKEIEVDGEVKKNDTVDVDMTGPEIVPTKNEQSMNESLNTTGFEDVENLPCIGILDSSLLLSPIGELQADKESDTEKPGFLSGIRKTGMSLFGNTEEKPDSSNSLNSFTFDFGGAKKNRGGLFNMFG